MKKFFFLIALGFSLSGCGGGGGGDSSGAQGSNQIPQVEDCLKGHRLLRQGATFGKNYADTVEAFAAAVIDCGVSKQALLEHARTLHSENTEKGAAQ